MSGVKRQQEDGGGGGGGAGGGPPQRKKILFEPCGLGAVSTLEEMDIQVLRFQHHKLKQRLELRQKLEHDLRGRIEQLEKRQTQDDLVLNVINRYWNQLNEDIRILLQRFDTETSDESESKNENEATTSFLTQLSTWDKIELDEKLQNRVQVSTRAVAKIIQAFDRLQQRNQKVSNSLHSINTEVSSSSSVSLDPVFKQLYTDLELENQSIQALNTALHEKYRGMSLKMMDLQEKLTAEETKRDELQNRVDDLNWEVTKLISQNDKLLNDSQQLKDKYRRLQEMYGCGTAGTSAGATTTTECGGGESEDKQVDPISSPKVVQMSDRELENLERDNEELRELATNRLSELERLHDSHKETLKQLENLRLELKHLPESVIVETTEFKCLQSKFSVVYNDNLNLRQVLDENKVKLRMVEESQLRNMENMDRDEEKNQNILKADMLGIQRRLEEERRKYEMLTVEFEENLKANEQAGPISQEMRHLIGSLQGHNQQLKRDVQKYREKWKEVMGENGRLKRELEEKGVIISGGVDGGGDEDKPCCSSSVVMSSAVKPDSTVDCPPGGQGRGSVVGKSDAEVIKELRSQLKRAINEQKEMKLLLDMYKGASKDQRDKVQLMASERKVREELTDVREQLKRVYADNRKDERKKMADEDAVKKIKALEDMVFQLQKQVTAQQQEEEALITEMEVTGTAYEEMQEQNARLLQQLREKDDANFKLMSERIKQSHVQQNGLEKVEELKGMVERKMRLVEAKDQYVRELEGREEGLMSKMTQMEKEAGLRQQAMELHKRKAIESAQSAQDLKMHLEKYHGQMKDAQQIVAEKTAALEAESWKTKRMQEEMIGLKRRLEHLRKLEMAGVDTADQVLMEEIREYKEMLTCPSCKVKRKDAVLTKCFHVFCMDCLRTRYETRQRKCPKCNAGFGANDYHRLYLS